MNGFYWSGETVLFAERAQRKNGYCKKIAGMLLPRLSKEDTVLDAGCGTGGLSLAVAPYVKRVLSLDTDPRALEVLERSVKEQGFENVRPVCADVFGFTPPEKPNVLICCSFGHPGEVPALAKKLGVKTILLVKRDHREHRFSKNSHPVEGDSAASAEEELASLGIPFTSERFTAEAGQPFKDLAEARLFFSAYGREDASVYTDDFLKSRLIPSNDPEFPLYLPNERQLTLIAFNGKDIP